MDGPESERRIFRLKHCQNEENLELNEAGKENMDIGVGQIGNI